jgi:hypothetical protein
MDASERAETRMQTCGKIVKASQEVSMVAEATTGVVASVASLVAFFIKKTEERRLKKYAEAHETTAQKWSFKHDDLATILRSAHQPQRIRFRPSEEDDEPIDVEVAE